MIMSIINQRYFEKPTQVKFFDPDSDDTWCGGIAYKDEVICACCGGVLKISEIIDKDESNGWEKVCIIPYDNWIDLSAEVMGDDEEDVLLYNLPATAYNKSELDYHAIDN